MSSGGEDGAGEVEASEEETETGDCSLDEWGWDSSVDQFLLEIVEEAPRRGSYVDFAWVSVQFLDVLEPGDGQIDEALVRFSPAALEERWNYLTWQIQKEASKAGSEAATAPGLEESECPQARLPERDRVLDAMQKFFFGRPSPGKDPAAPGALVLHEACVAAEAPIDPPSLGASTRARVQGACVAAAAAASRGLATAHDEPAAVCWVSAEQPRPEAVDEGAPALSSATAEVHSLAKTAGSSSAAGPDAAAGAGSSNEALRRCLEELRWHGEALRLCSAGGDAAELCVEAAARRKALLWSLGVSNGLPP